MFERRRGPQRLQIAGDQDEVYWGGGGGAGGRELYIPFFNLVTSACWPIGEPLTCGCVTDTAERIVLMERY